MTQREPLEYEIYRQRMIDYQLQMNAVEAQRAIINMGRNASQSSPQYVAPQVITQEVPVIHTVEVVREVDVTPLENKIYDLQDDVELKDHEVKLLKKTLEETEKYANEMYQHFMAGNERWEWAMGTIDRLQLEILRLKGELERLGGIKQAITPQHTPKARKPALGRSSEPQGHSDQSSSVLIRWVMKKSLENLMGGKKEVYVPTDDERKSLEFMEQHKLFRMNQFEVPTEYEHIKNMEIWNSV